MGSIGALLEGNASTWACATPGDSHSCFSWCCFCTCWVSKCRKIHGLTEKKVPCFMEISKYFIRCMCWESFNHYSYFTALIKLYCNYVFREPVAKDAGRNEYLIYISTVPSHVKYFICNLFTILQKYLFLINKAIDAPQKLRNLLKLTQLVYRANTTEILKTNGTELYYPIWGYLIKSQ